MNRHSQGIDIVRVSICRRDIRQCNRPDDHFRSLLKFHMGFSRGSQAEHHFITQDIVASRISRFHGACQGQRQLCPGYLRGSPALIRVIGKLLKHFVQGLSENLTSDDP